MPVLRRAIGVLLLFGFVFLTACRVGGAQTNTSSIDSPMTLPLGKSLYDARVVVDVREESLLIGVSDPGWERAIGEGQRCSVTFEADGRQVDLDAKAQENDQDPRSEPAALLSMAAVVDVEADFDDLVDGLDVQCSVFVPNADDWEYQIRIEADKDLRDTCRNSDTRSTCRIKRMISEVVINNRGIVSLGFNLWGEVWGSYLVAGVDE